MFSLLLMTALAASTNSLPNRHNLVLIMADDVGHECFGCYGSLQYKTPRIDQMAQHGLRFTHCYSQPLCTPSRVKLMTGLSNARNYAAFSVLRRDQTTIGQYLHDAGYRTMIAGKWQLLGSEHYRESVRRKGTWPLDAGFEECCLWQVNQLGARYWQPLLNLNGHNRQFGADDYGPDVCTQAILDFISTSSDRPFFVYYPMILVHSPFLPSPESNAPENPNPQRNFEDMVSYLDTIVGKIIDHLKSRNVLENTLVLFTSDNGTHRSLLSQLNGQTIPGGKGRTTDAGTRVPLVAYGPDTIPDGQTCNDLVDFSDFLPTLLSAAREETPANLDGVSFWPQLQGRPAEGRPWIHSYYCPRPEKTSPIRFVRDQRWKLYRNGQFFDTQSDVLEQHPLNLHQLDVTGRESHSILTENHKAFGS